MLITRDNAKVAVSNYHHLLDLPFENDAAYAARATWEQLFIQWVTNP